MPSIALDSGPAFALFDEADRHHTRVAAWIDRVPAGALVTNVAVLTEVCCFLGPRARHFLAWVEEVVAVHEVFSQDLPRIRQVLADYEDQDVDLADASLIAMCERLRIRKVATLDVRHFAVYRTSRGKAFDLVLT